MLVHMFYWNKCTRFEFKSSFDIQIDLSFKRSRKGKEKEIKEQTQIPAQAARPAPFSPWAGPPSRGSILPLSLSFSLALSRPGPRALAPPRSPHLLG
jgi:hypothetical protein